MEDQSYENRGRMCLRPRIIKERGEIDLGGVPKGGGRRCRKTLDTWDVKMAQNIDAFGPFLAQGGTSGMLDLGLEPEGIKTAPGGEGGIISNWVVHIREGWGKRDKKSARVNSATIQESSRKEYCQNHGTPAKKRGTRKWRMQPVQQML